jgi:hypothetical protein
MEFVTKLVEGKFPITTASSPKPQEHHHAGPGALAAQPAAHRDPDQRKKFKGV